MSTSIYDNMLAKYPIASQEDLKNATFEVMQQIVLAGLYRSGFFDIAAFYGGTCLRIFHGLQRFSEDLDFSLLAPDPEFNLENYFATIVEEFRGLGKDVVISKKQKSQRSPVESAFLKADTKIYDLSFTTGKTIKIKIEVDTQPPLGFATEQKLLLSPFSFLTRCYSLPDLYAGKMHAFLFRNWKNRVKGRDWYDFEYYVRHQVPLNFAHFKNRMLQFNSIAIANYHVADFKIDLRERIKSTNLAAVIDDVKPFVKNPSDLDLWSVEYFLRLVDLICFI
ncbi:MAG: nucleotidyl transferase AbiEii/AbiGii toxin family protein [Fibrobacter sp.]|nr:nucleotidyl transferase AbiEii/AbiGii toxin family protein [Fibrobacter sp.]